MTAQRVAGRRCPFCGEAILDRRTLSMDHVFGKALGGRVTVPAHRMCNNQSGSGAEGDLQRPNTLLNLMKSVHGLDASSVRVTFSSGRIASLDLATGRASAPPEVARGDDGLIVRIEGTAQQVEAVYDKHRSRHPELGLPEYGNLPPGCVSSVSYETVQADLQLPLAAAEAVAIKSALGACTLAYGDAFSETPLASALRRMQSNPDARNPVETPAGTGRLAMLDAMISQFATQVGMPSAEISALPRLVPSAGAVVHDVILVQSGKNTLLYAHYLSELIPPYPLAIEARLPELTPGLRPVLPVLLRDDGTTGRLQVTDFTQVVMQPVIDSAIAGEPDEDGEGS
jgi:hypothetical protein